MWGRKTIYGLDIETDNSNGFGLDPRNAGITEISVAVEGGGEVFALEDFVSEQNLLVETHTYLASLKPGLISTWNGSVFDLPFIVDRLTRHELPREYGPLLSADEEIVPKYEPLPGHAGGYSAIWPIGGGFAHQHLDVAFAYRKIADDLDVKWSLKPVCGALGIDMIELDRENLHTYSSAERKAYCLSDGHGTRDLALLLLGLA